MSLFTPKEREEIADRVCRLLGDDGCVEGVVVVGSLAGQGDRWSDIEVIITEDEDLTAVAGDWVGSLYELFPVVHQFETAFGETLVRGFLLENLLELDLAFEQAGRFSTWGPARVAFDRSGRGMEAAASPCGADAPGKDYGTWSVSETAS